MPAFTVHPMFAELIVLGVKRIETRSRLTKFRGRIGVHASAADPDRAPRDSALAAVWEAALAAIPHGRPVSSGAVVGTVEVVDCVPMVDRYQPWGSHLRLGGSRSARLYGADGPAGECEDVGDQLPFGVFAAGRWAVLLRDPVRFEVPVPAKGSLSFPWRWPDLVVES